MEFLIIFLKREFFFKILLKKFNVLNMTLAYNIVYSS
jgi:hypothetical protein